MKRALSAAAVGFAVIVAAPAADAQTQTWKLQTSAQAGDFYF